MSKLAQEAPQSFRGRMFQQDKSRPKEKRILVLRTGIAGKNFHIESEEELVALERLTPGTELLLYREPNNEHDRWAIAVHLTEEDKLGFVSRFKNETIARLMDEGKRFIGVVDDREERKAEDQPADQEPRRRRYAYTEDLSLPFSIYMIEDEY